jgi:hypothetical protein
MLDSGGHFAVLTFRADQPKFASNNRLEATAEESKALLSGTLGHYGTYTVADNVLVFHIERSTFPNWNGIEQKRSRQSRKQGSTFPGDPLLSGRRLPLGERQARI